MDYWHEISEKIRENNLNVDLDKIRLAFSFAEESHEGQNRKSGEAYIMHPVEVTKILIDMKMDTDTIVAGILHDIVEDTLVTLAEVQYNFGETVALMVDGVTKLGNLPNGTKRQDENIRKMILAMAKDIRVILIKLADRLHNMRTLKYMAPDRQQAISQETLHVYAPLAHRLGIARIKWELEDLCLHYLYPDKYNHIKELVDSRRDERKEYMDNFIAVVVKLLAENNIKGIVKGRFKHFYSIYKKMYEKNKDFDDIYDLIGLRVIVNTEGECYNVLGIIHSQFTPVAGRIKDYIAVPKSNNYQSIHTTIVGPQGKFIEIQIRTDEMDKVAEEGIAAHWLYKEHGKASKDDKVYGWLRNILELQNESENANEFVKNVTEDIVSEAVLVFSPKGDITELPEGATPIDFAFAIHTNVGCRCCGAKVNGRIVPLDSKLHNGDRVEIITSKNMKWPPKDWLDIAVTASAKSKIRKMLKEKNYEEIMNLGKDTFEKELDKIGLTSKQAEEDILVKKYMEKNNIKSIDDFYYNMGENRSKLDILLDKFKANIEKEKEDKAREVSGADLSEIVREDRVKTSKNDFGVVIEGVSNTLIKFAKCCTPLPGDSIGGYVTKLEGITIHRTSCQNFQNMLAHEPGREIPVSWAKSAVEQSENKYKFTFNVLVEDKPNVLMSVISVISEQKINIVGVNSGLTEQNGERIMTLKFTIEISDKREYEQLAREIRKKKDVISIDR